MIQVKSLVIQKSGKWIFGEIDPYFTVNSACVLYSVCCKGKNNVIFRCYDKIMNDEVVRCCI